MDRTMTYAKIASRRAANDPLAPLVHSHQKAVKAKQRGEDAEIEALSISDDDDFGGDPYNRTGSFCVPDFKD